MADAVHERLATEAGLDKLGARTGRSSTEVERNLLS